MRLLFSVFVCFCVLVCRVSAVTANAYYTGTYGTLQMQCVVTGYEITGTGVTEVVTFYYKVAVKGQSPNVAYLPVAAYGYVIYLANVGVPVEIIKTSPYRYSKTGTVSTPPGTVFGTEGGRRFATFSIQNTGNSFPASVKRVYLDVPIDEYQVTLRNSSDFATQYVVKDAGGGTLQDIWLAPGQAISAPVYGQGGGNVTVTRKPVVPTFNGVVVDDQYQPVPIRLKRRLRRTPTDIKPASGGRGRWHGASNVGA
ncbi:MAG: hypothetical protein IPL86_16750 [Flavobacteriales bacterium]|nr:hypothetical protein [Flavobacteriales bacterium]